MALLAAASMAGRGHGAGGLDYNFLSEPNGSLRCSICLAVARDPLQHEGCGKLFCDRCISKYGKAKPCPNCRGRGLRFYPDHKSKLKLTSLW